MHPCPSPQCHMFLSKYGYSYHILFLQVVQLEIADLDIEFHPDCDYDYVEFIDTITGISLGKLCGDNPYTMPTYMSSSNNMVVRFVSDGSSELRGFTANFQGLDNSGKSETFHKSQSFINCVISSSTLGISYVCILSCSFYLLYQTRFAVQMVLPWSSTAESLHHLDSRGIFNRHVTPTHGRLLH